MRGALVPMLLAALALSATPAAKGAAAARPLLWGTDAEGGAPYIFKDPKDPTHNIGFEVEIVAEIEKELGQPIVVRQYAFSSLILGLQRGDFDFGMNGL
ncbi:MAG TPA: transporter substrate-binding domain-containing protein, partial [Candidatus Polarisedimenticolia bacterium]|nr:transporter substrate-binding domain-containing protein [Candidatus Polarisedimenticolia bacterium]